MDALQFVESMLTKAGVEINGKNPWDPRMKDPADWARKVLRGGSKAFGNLYVLGYEQGGWDCDNSEQFITKVLDADLRKYFEPKFGMLWLLMRSKLLNLPLRNPWRVARAHYDRDPEVFDLVLGEIGTYSCAYFEHSDDLKEAQQAKNDLICRKINLKAGDRVLEVGCGRGSFMVHAAKYGARCVGLSVSVGQTTWAKEQHEHLGLPIEFYLTPWQQFVCDEPFDHVVSIGAFEHFGRGNYKQFFRWMRSVVKEDNFSLIHTIVTENRTGKDPWLNQEIFPEAELPRVSHVYEAARGSFKIEELHTFGYYYALTLRKWLGNLRLHRGYIVEKYGIRLYRTWEHYLCSGVANFETRRVDLGQFLLTPRGVRGDVYHSIR
ncbi:MAG: class I SAM-dependent methyltransferase [bacterium]|nr:class I SAM-dependent methyltransferase [bacterium]